MTAHTNYIAVIGDIVDSRKLTDRDAVQQQLKAALTAVNAKYSHAIASDFMITLGDEFQGLLHHGAEVMNLVDELAQAIQPVQLRFGLGVGGVDTAIDRALSVGADGPAYHRARAGVDTIKKADRRKKFATGSVVLTSDNPDCDALVNALLAVCDYQKSKWWQRQREVISAYTQNGHNQKQAAASLAISQSGVSHSLSASGYYAYEQAMRQLNATIERTRADCHG